MFKVVYVITVALLLQTIVSIRVPNSWDNEEPTPEIAEKEVEESDENSKRDYLNEEGPQDFQNAFNPDGFVDFEKIVFLKPSEKLKKVKYPIPNNEEIKINPESFFPLKNTINNLKESQLKHFSNPKEEYPETTTPRPEEEKPEEYKIYLNEEQKFLKQNNDFNNDFRKFEAENIHDASSSEDESEELKSDKNNENVSEQQEQEEDDEEEAFVPIKMHAQVRHSETNSYHPTHEFEDPRVKEKLILDKSHVVYSEEGYEDLGYDHAGHEKEAAHVEGDADLLIKKEIPIIAQDKSNSVKAQKDTIRRKKRSSDDDLEKDVDDLILTEFDVYPKRIEKSENLDEKYPYYKTIGNILSAKRYAENLENVPLKTSDSSFYASRRKRCTEIESSIDPIPDRIKDKLNSRPKREAEKTKRLDGLGDKIDCFKAKYFGEEPLDSPIFIEELIEQPQNPFLRQRRNKNTKRNIGSIERPKYLRLESVINPQLGVYFDVMETIKADLLKRKMEELSKFGVKEKRESTTRKPRWQRKLELETLTDVENKTPFEDTSAINEDVTEAPKVMHYVGAEENENLQNDDEVKIYLSQQPENENENKVNTSENEEKNSEENFENHNYDANTVNHDENEEKPLPLSLENVQYMYNNDKVNENENQEEVKQDIPFNNNQYIISEDNKNSEDDNIKVYELNVGQDKSESKNDSNLSYKNQYPMNEESKELNSNNGEKVNIKKRPDNIEDIIKIAEYKSDVQGSVVDNRRKEPRYNDIKPFEFNFNIPIFDINKYLPKIYEFVVTPKNYSSRFDASKYKLPLAKYLTTRVPFSESEENNSNITIEHDNKENRLLNHNYKENPEEMKFKHTVEIPQHLVQENNYLEKNENLHKDEMAANEEEQNEKEQVIDRRADDEVDDEDASKQEDETKEIEDT